MHTTATGTKETNKSLLAIAKGIWKELEAERKKREINSLIPTSKKPVSVSQMRENYINKPSIDNTRNVPKQ